MDSPVKFEPKGIVLLRLPPIWWSIQGSPTRIRKKRFTTSSCPSRILVTMHLVVAVAHRLLTSTERSLPLSQEGTQRTIRSKGSRFSVSYQTLTFLHRAVVPNPSLNLTLHSLPVFGPPFHSGPNTGKLFLAD